MPARLRVLIVDDHPGIVKSVSRLLAHDCDVVGSAKDWGGLLEAMLRLEPDVIVLDLHLPDVDGLEACRQITQVRPGISVIVFTAAGDADARQRALAAGASAYVDKLAPGGDLLSAVRRLEAAH